jgi:hypothetical protein
LFVVEAVLLFGFGVLGTKIQFHKGGSVRFAVGIALWAVSAFVPFEWLWDQTLRQTLLFGWGPDRTAVGTIGVLLIAEGRMVRLLLVPPVIWCLIASLMYYGAR